MTIDFLNKKIEKSINDLYNVDIPSNVCQINKTKSDFEGDFTLIIFPFLSFSKTDLLTTANEIANILKDFDEIDSFNIVKGFLNLNLSDGFLSNLFKTAVESKNYGFLSSKSNSETTLVEFSSPNTNKPLHLGHIRNNLIGFAISNIFKACGHNVKMVQVINDRGIHICKSMLAWLKYGNGKTPASEKVKGDFFVGQYYILFEKKLKEEINKIGDKNIIPNILIEAQEMLVKWENKDPEIIKLWNMMNNWVYEGMDITYKKLGIVFDKNYYESDTYLDGKRIVNEFLDKNIFFSKEDNSVWVDLSKYNLDEKLLLRSDGTAVYMTQDIGTAFSRYKDFNFDNMIYVTGNEQNYHFQTLFKILEKLSCHWAKKCFHLSYGMVDLPTGKMKSREGTVVDADDLIDKMRNDSFNLIKKSNKFDDFNDEEIKDLSNIVGDGALKYFILKVDSKKNIMFNPEDSIDFNGNTAPFIQYTYARINSVLSKKKDFKNCYNSFEEMGSVEKALIKIIIEFPNCIKQCKESLNPAFLANYIYHLAKTYNKFYQKVPILDGSRNENFRLTISKKVSLVIKNGMRLLGIDVPNRM
tara:strand:+ start:359 stop:2107 length:1749 start_codon:yes stop_codon:yes gene_type:complete